MIAYLDNSATTRVCPQAIAAVTRCMDEGYFNPSSVYAPAVEAFRDVRACRERILQTLHGSDCELTFTSGGTEANNLAILGSVAHMRGRQLLAVSTVEHPSVRVCFDELENEGHEVRRVGVDSHGELDWEALSRSLNDGASLVSCMQVNNETGALLDIRKLYALVNGRALVHIDGVQGYLRVPMDMRYCDLYSISGHKIHAPKGIGALIWKKGIRLAARQLGGGQENNLRSGTENTPGIAGLAAAVEAMVSLGPDMPEKLMAMKLYLIERFREAVPELLINGPEPEAAAPHIVNLSFPGVRGEVMLHALEEEGVYASTGSACSSKKRKLSPVLTAMGIDADRAECALRFSLSPHTTRVEIDLATDALAKLYPQLRKYARR